MIPYLREFLTLQLTGITQRVNTINGRKYSEDPTIFAWELCNECQWVLPADYPALLLSQELVNACLYM